VLLWIFKSLEVAHLQETIVKARSRAIKKRPEDRARRLMFNIAQTRRARAATVGVIGRQSTSDERPR
jgi:hypothetical protein